MISLISNLDSSVDLIKFFIHLNKYPNSPWIRTLFTIILVNSSLNLKIGDFHIYFDTNLCVFSDRANSFRQEAHSTSLS